LALKTDTFIGGIICYFARHGTIANLLLAVMIVLGLVSITKIRAQFFPDVIIETVTVKAIWKGAGPEDIDNGLVSIIEPSLIGIDSVDSISAVSREGSMQISIDFQPGSDMGLALQNVKDAIDGVQNLPKNVDDISVKRRQWRDRVTNVVLSGPVPIEQLSRFADEFSQSLNRLGISKSTINGVSAPILRVLVPEHALVGHDISLSTIASAIKSNAEAVPACVGKPTDSRSASSASPEVIHFVSSSSLVISNFKSVFFGATKSHTPFTDVVSPLTLTFTISLRLFVTTLPPMNTSFLIARSALPNSNTLKLNSLEVPSASSHV